MNIKNLFKRKRMRSWGKGCGAVEIFDFGNSAHARLAQEAELMAEADWRQATVRQGSGRMFFYARRHKKTEQSELCSDVV